MHSLLVAGGGEPHCRGGGQHPDTAQGRGIHFVHRVLVGVVRPIRPVAKLHGWHAHAAVVEHVVVAARAVRRHAPVKQVVRAVRRYQIGLLDLLSDVFD